MASITGVMIGDGTQVTSWKVTICETRIGLRKRSYRGLTVHGEKNEPLPTVIERAKAMHKSAMIACGHAETPYTEIVFIDQFGKLVPSPNIPTPHP